MICVKIIIVRHGETYSNQKGTYLGWTDIDLNQTGVEQAHEAKEKLKKEKIDIIYSSPLKRAIRTAEIINENHNLDILMSAKIKERNFGKWDDLTYKEVTAKYPDEFAAWTSDWINYKIEHGESAIESYQRVCNFTDDVLSRHIDKTVLIVAHSGSIRYMLAHLLGLNIELSWRFQINNAGITKVKVYDNYPVLTKLNY